MRQRLPPLQWLRSFEAAARHMSFTLAAGELGVKQSAVSQQVKALEHYLDQALFLRRPRSLELTDAGRHYLPTVREAFSVLEEGTSWFLGHDPDRVVEVKANTAFSVLWLAPRLGDFFRACPEVEVNLSTAMWDADFTGGYGSVEIRFGRGEWGHESDQVLSRASIFPVAAPSLAERIAALDDLRGETLLHIGRTTYDWERWLEAMGEPALTGRNAHYFNTYVMSLDLARRGLGVAMAHDILVSDLIRRGELVRLFDQAVPVREAYYLFGPRHGAMSRAAEAFCAWLKETLRAAPGGAT